MSVQWQNCLELQFDDDSQSFKCAKCIDTHVIND